MDNKKINTDIKINKNNTNFPIELNNILKELYSNNTDIIKKSLFEYQRYIYNYMVHTDNRGILLYHSVGSGKTLTSISIAEEFRNLKKDIIIISSKSLQANYKKEIEKFNKMINPEINDEEIEEIVTQYKYVTSNSKNMISSLDDKLFNVLNNKNSDSKVNLENKIIIIDEAHNLFNSIVNGSKIANEFYDLIMNTKKIKLIFLTGTPIINNPFEIAVAFNMLYGKIINKEYKFKKSKEYYTILPEYYTDFQQYFINQSNNSIKNENKFKNRIYGLVSYYGDMYTDILESIKDSIKSTKIKENYPDRLSIKIEIIEMSNIQNAEYTKARDIEKRENTKIGSSIFKEKNIASTSYRIKSRQLSNIFIPGTPELTIYNFDKYSPKLVKIFKNINENHKNQISLVYSNFLESGLIAFSKFLELNNYINYNSKNDSDKLKYAIFSGQQTPEERSEIIKLVNSNNNLNGQKISILLISKSGAEGLDLKNIRSVHIMEPYWNYSLIEQIIARAVRYKSHELLNKNDQNVQTYIYLSDYNKQYLIKEKEKIKEKSKSKRKKNKIEFTTDINIFKNAIKSQELIQIFLKTIASTSIECEFLNSKNINYECFTCLNNNKQLYYPDIHKDILLSNSCIKSKKITAEEIIINGDKFYYTKDKDDIKIFKYNSILNAYQLYENNNILNKIKNLS